MDVVNEVLRKTSKEALESQFVEVKKHLDLEFDLGFMLAYDPNEFDRERLRRNEEQYFLELARENTQLMLNQLCALPKERVEEAIMVKLPPGKLKLPRRQSVPRPKPLTKWQKFAQEKGIQKKAKSKLSWDDQLQKWIPLFGYKRAKAENDKNWVLEVPQNADPNQDQFAKKAGTRSENVAKNELQRLRNIAKNKNIKIPRVGVANQEVASAKDLQAAVTIAKASTASLGKFQDKLPKEKEARGVASITPGASRKRKLPPIAGDVEKKANLDLVDSILNKKPKLELAKAVEKHISSTRLNSNENVPSQERSRGGNKSKAGRKPKSVKGQRTGGKKGGGRKRR